jgi:hypothetical protein
VGAAAVAAALGAIADATGNQDLGKAATALGDVAGGATTAGSVAAGLAPTLAGEAAAETGAGVGVGAGAGAAFAPIAGMLIATSIANLIKPGSAPDLSDIWTVGGTDFKGKSKIASAQKTEAAQSWDKSQKTMEDALTAAQAAQKGDITDPAQLRQIGDALMKGETSYYLPDETPNGARIMGKEIGPSTYITGANRPDAMQPFNQGMQTWLALNKALIDQGQPGLTITPDMAAATGIDKPTFGTVTDPNTGMLIDPSQLTPDQWAAAAQWGPAGPPPNMGNYGVIVDPSSPEYQAWLNKAFLAYEQAGGMPTGQWPTPAPVDPTAAAAVEALGGASGTGGVTASGLDKNVPPPPAAAAAPTAIDALTSPTVMMGELPSGLDKNVMPAAA